VSVDCIVDASQPRTLPEDEAVSLATTVRRAVAAHVFEVDRVLHSPQAGLIDGIASLVGSPEDPELLAAVLQHLRHEGQAVDRTGTVEACQDLGLGPDFHEFPDTQWTSSGPA